VTQRSTFLGAYALSTLTGLSPRCTPDGIPYATPSSHGMLRESCLILLLVAAAPLSSFLQLDELEAAHAKIQALQEVFSTQADFDRFVRSSRLCAAPTPHACRVHLSALYLAPADSGLQFDDVARLIFSGPALVCGH